MGEPTVYVLSVHDSADGGLSVDLKDLLQALRGFLSRWTWCIRDLDAAGEDLNGLCQATWEAPVWFSSNELLALSQRVQQTVEGVFLAFPEWLKAAELDPAELEVGRFPHSRCELAITAVDSSYFEIYAKDIGCADAIRQHFKDVRLQDPRVVF